MMSVSTSSFAGNVSASSGYIGTPPSQVFPIMFFYTSAGHTSGTVPVGHGITPPGTMTIRAPGNLQRAGYQFIGWRNGSTIFQPGQYFRYDAGRHGHFFFEAVWGRNVTVTFNGNGGSPGTRTEVRGAGGRMGTLPTPFWLATDFVGWYNTSAPTGGTRFTENSTVPAGGITLWARWEVSVWFGGSGGSPNLQSFRMRVGSVLGTSGVQQPTRAGHTFAGWINTNEQPVNLNTTLVRMGNQSINATWTPNTITLTFNANGGTPASQTVNRVFGTNVTMPPQQPTWAGRTFVGWFNTPNATGGTQITTSTAVPATNTRYYARWTANMITLTFNSNGGNLAEQTIQVTQGSTLTTMPTTPTRAGFVFAGWFTTQSAVESRTFTGSRIDVGMAAPNASTRYWARWIRPLLINYEILVNTTDNAARTRANNSINEIAPLFWRYFGVDFQQVQGSPRFANELNSVVLNGVANPSAVLDQVPSNWNTVRFRYVNFGLTGNVYGMGRSAGGADGPSRRLGETVVRTHYLGGALVNPARLRYAIVHEISHMFSITDHCRNVCVMNATIDDASFNRWCDPCRNIMHGYLSRLWLDHAAAGVRHPTGRR